MSKQNIWQSFWLWFDVETPSTLSHQKYDIFRVLPFLGVHFGAICCVFYPVNSFYLYNMVISYLIRMFAITAFYHRFFAHKSYKTNRFFQGVFAFIGGTAVQRGACWWAAHHRAHHRHSDTGSDPHSPVFHTFLYSHLLWFLETKNFSYRKDYVPDLVKYPELVFLNRFDMIPPILYGISIFAVGEYLQTQGYPCTGLGLFLWAFCLSTTLLYHATFSINSVGHIWGERPFKTKDKSRNNVFLALITFGEGWHNNHHYWPSSVRQGFKWYQLDITYIILKVFEKLKIIHDLKYLPKDLSNS